jgi:hypothetical protein
MLTKKITLLAISLVIFLPNIALAEQDVIINNSTVEVRNGKAKTTTEQNRVINKQESIINNDDDDDETSDKGDEVKAGKVKVTRDKNGGIKVETGNSTVKVDSNSRTSIRRNNRQPNLNNNKPGTTATNKTTTTTVNTTTIKKGNNTVINSKITCNSNKQQSTQTTKIVGSGKKVTQNTSVVKCP